MRLTRIWGLTGGIASGKSTAAAILEELGAAIVDCDWVSRELTQPGQPLLAALARQFGPQILDGAGRLRRRYLGELVFADPQRLEALNELVHPAIWRTTFKEADQAARRWPIVFVVAPLLFEHGAEAAFDGVLVVDISPSLQLERLRQRDKLNLKEAQERISAQMSLEDKASRATVVVENNGSRSHLESQLRAFWEERIAPVYDGCARS